MVCVFPILLTFGYGLFPHSMGFVLASAHACGVTTQRQQKCRLLEQRRAQAKNLHDIVQIWA